MILDVERQHEAWTTWARPDEIHAFGCELAYDRTSDRSRQVSRCQMMVRVELEHPFDPDDPKACPDCAEGYRRGLPMAETVALRRARESLMPTSGTIICKRRTIRG